jgi:tetratricopeptide (TPR) repeat protein
VTGYSKLWLLGGFAGALGAAVTLWNSAPAEHAWGACNRNGDKKAAIDACSELLQTNLQPKQRSKALAIRAFFTNEVGEDADLSLADLEEAVYLDPHSSYAVSVRGLVYSRLKQYDQAIVDFTRAIELSPKAWIYDSRGKVHLKAGNYEAAFADFSHAVELDVKFAKAWRHRGESRAALKDYEGAKQNLMTALRLRPNYRPAKQTLEQIEALIGKSGLPHGATFPEVEDDDD